MKKPNPIMPANARHKFKSAHWIAHNIAMDEKRDLLGKGPRPRIGVLYRPAIVRTAAIHTGPRVLTLGDKLKSAAMLAAFIAVMVFFAFAGSAAGM